MSMILKPNEICSHLYECPYARHISTGHFCQGTVPRSCDFVCEYVENGKLKMVGEIRTKHNMTGRMKVLMETGGG